MKKKIILFLLGFMVCSMIHSESKKILNLELYVSREKNIEFTNLDSEFEFVSLFYQNIFFNFELLNRINKDDLRKICLIVYENIKNGYGCQIVVKKYINKQDLLINFGQMPDINDNLLITTNYDRNSNKIITNEEDLKDSLCFLYYLIDEKLVYYTDADLYNIPAEKKLQNNLNKISHDSNPITYITIVENYFEMGEIEKGLEFLDENENRIIELSPKTTKPRNVNEVILCMQEEGKVLLELKQLVKNEN